MEQEYKLITDRHDSEETALIVENYPYGFLRTKIRYWTETTKNGDRFVSQTLNPKTQKWNKEKKSTYSNVMVLTTEIKTGYTKTYSWSVDYTEEKDLLKFLNFCGNYPFNELQKEKIKFGKAIYKTREHISIKITDTTNEDELQRLIRDKQQQEVNKDINKIFNHYIQNETKNNKCL